MFSTCDSNRLNGFVFDCQCVCGTARYPAKGQRTHSQALVIDRSDSSAMLAAGTRLTRQPRNPPNTWVTVVKRVRKPNLSYGESNTRQMQRYFRIADHRERPTLLVGCGAGSISRSGAGTLSVQDMSCGRIVTTGTVMGCLCGVDLFVGGAIRTCNVAIGWR
jgi:hypothetical protein